MKAEGTVTLEVRISTNINSTHTLQEIKDRLIIAANEHVKNNKIKANVTNILIRNPEINTEDEK